MLQFAESTGPASLRLLLRHDDAAREFDYVAGAEQALWHEPRAQRYIALE